MFCSPFCFIKRYVDEVSFLVGRTHFSAFILGFQGFRKIFLFVRLEVCVCCLRQNAGLMTSKLLLLAVTGHLLWEMFVLHIRYQTTLAESRFFSDVFPFLEVKPYTNMSKVDSSATTAHPVFNFGVRSGFICSRSPNLIWQK